MSTYIYLTNAYFITHNLHDWICTVHAYTSFYSHTHTRGFLMYTNCMMQSLTVITRKLHLAGSIQQWWSCGAMVACLTPDQKVACSNHVGIITFFFYFLPIPTPCKLMNTLIHLVLNPQYWTICTVYNMKNYFKDWKEVRILRRKLS